jgi:hypothetical protein
MDKKNKTQEKINCINAGAFWQVLLSAHLLPGG